jgi:YD repeat-containing protein
MLGEKIEEDYFDASDKSTKKHVYTYDGKGLKTERKTLDADGKIVSVKKYVYITK